MHKMEFTCTRRAALAVAACAAVAVSFPALAGKLASPKGEVILTVEGDIAESNDGAKASFDREMLESLGMVSFKTATPWFSGEVEFEGVPIAKLMEAVGAKGEDVEIVALNDYKVRVPIDGFTRYGAIMALKRDGSYMPVSDKGPLFIVYPFDKDPELKKQKFYARSVWQVARMIVK